jgi:hypothetical protein
MRREHAPCPEVPGYCLRPGEGPHCICGHYYPQTCQGGHLILPALKRRYVEVLAFYGMPFVQIAARTGLSVHAVRKIVHGVRGPQVQVRQP